MPRVVGIDPGTVTIDLCGVEDGRVFLDVALPTADALADPAVIVNILRGGGNLDLVAGPSGYGLPLMRARDASDADLRLAYLAAPGESGGIGGLRSLLRALARSDLPVMMLPGVVHLMSVPPHRKVNRVDMGTADKVCAAALAVSRVAARRACEPQDVSCILLELGGAFSAALAVEGGRIVDGLGGTSGPLGVRAAGALDGEAAFLAGVVTKEMLFRGGRGDVGGDVGREAFLEGLVKATAMLMVTVPAAGEVLLSGRFAADADVAGELTRRIGSFRRGLAVHVLDGFASTAGQAAQGAALIADGLAGGAAAALVERLGIREASGSVLDHLHVISPATARARLGLA